MQCSLLKLYSALDCPRCRAASLVAATGVRSNIMRNRPATLVTAALLMLQLAIGLAWQTAHATSALPEHSMSGMEAGHCPGHQSTDSTIDKKHDCCHSLGCQCHSAQSPGALNLPPTRAAFSSLDLLPTFDARPPVARTAEFFRPPIA
jgi:hypothetical protein